MELIIIVFWLSTKEAILDRNTCFRPKNYFNTYHIHIRSADSAHPNSINIISAQKAIISFLFF